MSNPLEKYDEGKFTAEVKQSGGLSIKLNPLWFKGIPDRLILLPGQIIFFIEFKRRSGGILSGIQQLIHRKLREMGFEVYVCSSRNEAINIVKGKLI